MPNLLLSINTKYVRNILSGSKKYELRGWIYKQNVDFIYIYSSGIEKKIVGRFNPAKVIAGTPDYIWENLSGDIGVNRMEYLSYINQFNYKIIYAIEIFNLEILDSFLNPCDIFNGFKAPQKFKYLSSSENDILARYFE